MSLTDLVWITPESKMESSIIQSVIALIVSGALASGGRIFLLKLTITWILGLHFLSYSAPSLYSSSFSSPTPLSPPSFHPSPPPLLLPGYVLERRDSYFFLSNFTNIEKRPFSRFVFELMQLNECSPGLKRNNFSLKNTKQTIPL